MKEMKRDKTDWKGGIGDANKRGKMSESKRINQGDKQEGGSEILRNNPINKETINNKIWKQE